jgi:hypothetical protein
MPPLTIRSLRGGLNDFDDAINLRDDQCTAATNVSFYRHPCGGRRYGSTAVDLGASAIAGQLEITWLFRHLPSDDDSEAELWAAAYSPLLGGSIALSYKDTAWHDVTIADTPTQTGNKNYRWSGATLHNKLFIAYPSAEDRLHVWDGTSLRRVGLIPPAAAPTAADTGGAGTLDGNRYYRVRETVQDGGVTILRSEPSDVLTHNPPGTNASITVTKPTTANSNATHWELEASLVVNGDYYVLATTVIGTSTVVDTTTEAAGYAGGTLSEEVGQYTVPHSARILLVDDDRLLLIGGWGDAELQSSVSWTPVENDDGVGNDERIPLDPVSTLNLDAGEGGKITAAGSAVTGEIWVFKRSQAYLLERTYHAERAYEATTMSKTIGALDGSVTPGVDEAGRPCVYFLDSALGPCRASRVFGIQRCGRDVAGSWATLWPDSDFTVITARALYYPDEQQVINFAALTPLQAIPPANVGNPTEALVLQVNEMRTVEGGEARGGWSRWKGALTNGMQAGCLFSDNINDDAARSHTLVPFIGTGGPTILYLDPDAIDDDGTVFQAQIRTKPYTPAGLMQQWELKSAVVVGEAVEDARLTIAAIPDFTESAAKTAEDVDFTPGAGGGREASDTTLVIRRLDDLAVADCTAIQLSFTDVDVPTAAWGLSQIGLRLTSGQEAS